MDNTSNYSVTQASNITVVVGLIVLILNHFHVNIGSDEISAVIGAAISIVGVIVSWVNRYKKGDLTAGGFRK